MPRMVRTPWFDEEIPFEEAAVGRHPQSHHGSLHIGVVMTTDGSITDIPRENYVEGRERVVNELKATGKPFVIVVNSAIP